MDKIFFFIKAKWYHIQVWFKNIVTWLMRTCPSSIKEINDDIPWMYFQRLISSFVRDESLKLITFNAVHPYSVTKKYFQRLRQDLIGKWLSAKLLFTYSFVTIRAFHHNDPKNILRAAENPSHKAAVWVI